MTIDGSLNFVAAPDMRGRGSPTPVGSAVFHPIEVVMASAKPKPDFDR